MWNNPEERFVVAVGFEDAAKCDLTLEVWDHDHLGRGDFLGQVMHNKMMKYRSLRGEWEYGTDSKARSPAPALASSVAGEREPPARIHGPRLCPPRKRLVPLYSASHLLSSLEPKTNTEE